MRWEERVEEFPAEKIIVKSIAAEVLPVLARNNIVLYDNTLGMEGTYYHPQDYLVSPPSQSLWVTFPEGTRGVERFLPFLGITNFWLLPDGSMLEYVKSNAITIRSGIAGGSDTLRLPESPREVRGYFGLEKPTVRFREGRTGPITDYQGKIAFAASGTIPQIAFENDSDDHLYEVKGARLNHKETVYFLDIQEI